MEKRIRITFELFSSFIEKCIFCEIPDIEVDEELHHLVIRLQTHRCIKPKCKKKRGAGCRYNFPRLPSERTIITVGQHCDEYKELDPSVKKLINDMFGQVKGALVKENAEKFTNLDDFLKSLKIKKETY